METGHGLKSHPTDGEAVIRTCDPWFIRRAVYLLHHGCSRIMKGTGTVTFVIRVLRIIAGARQS